MNTRFRPYRLALLLGLLVLLLPLISVIGLSQPSVRLGAPWNPIVIPDLRRETGVDPMRRVGGLLLVGTREQGLFRSTDGGATWSQVRQHTTVSFRDVWLADDGRTALAATFGAGLLRSTDGGISWTSVAAEAGSYFLALAVTGDGVLYAGTQNRGIWKSTDNGLSWIATTFPAGAGAVILASVGNMVYAGSVTDGLWGTTDTGNTWQRLGFSGKLVRAVAFDPTTNTLAVSVWDDGVHMSTDGGSTWQRSSNGLEGTNVYALLVVNTPPAERELWAGTVGRGVLRWDRTANRWEPLALPGWNVLSLRQWGETVYAGSNGMLWAYAPPTEMQVVLYNDPVDDIAPGEAITYTIVYTNGPTAVKDVRIHNTVPEGVELVPDSISAGGRSTGREAGDIVVWAIGDLPARASGTVSYRVQRPIFTSTPTPTSTLTITTTVTPTWTPTPTFTPTITPTSTTTITPTVTPTLTFTPMPTDVPTTTTPTATPTTAPTSTPTPTITATPTSAPTATPILLPPVVNSGAYVTWISAGRLYVVTSQPVWNLGYRIWLPSFLRH